MTTMDMAKKAFANRRAADAWFKDAAPNFERFAELVREEERGEPTIFPLAGDDSRRGGWTLSVDFLRDVQKSAQDHAPYVSLEDTEAVLLAIIRMRSNEKLTGRPHHNTEKE